MVVMTIISCTDNTKAKNYGGKEIIKLNPKEKFINATWKENNLWIIVYDSTINQYKMREKSNYGLMEGTIIFSYKKD